MPFDSTNYRPMPIGHQRLLVLAEFLETKVPQKQFNIGFYWNHVEPDECGFAGCAMGWCPQVPAFRAAGWAYNKDEWGDRAPLYRNSKNPWQSVHRFFEIEHPTAQKFFAKYSYNDPPSPWQVASRIRSFVAEQSHADAKSA